MFVQVGIGVGASGYGKVVISGEKDCQTRGKPGLLNCILGVTANTAQSILRVSGTLTRSPLYTGDPNVRTCAGRWCACAAVTWPYWCGWECFGRVRTGSAAMCLHVGDKIASHMLDLVWRKSADRVEAWNMNVGKNVIGKQPANPGSKIGCLWYLPIVQ